MIYTCNLSPLGGWVGWIAWGHEFETSLVNIVKQSLLKLQKINQAWWWAPVIPTTWEAEAEGSLEPRKQRLRWAEIMPLHSSLGDKNKSPSQKEKKRKKIHSGNKYLQSTYLPKQLNPKYTNNSLNSTAGKQTIQSKKWADLKRDLIKEDIQKAKRVTQRIS